MGLGLARLSILEFKRNLQDKVPGAIADFDLFLDAVEFVLVQSPKSEIEAAMEYRAVKDAPIVAAAKTSAVAYLVCLDRRHIVGISEVSTGSGLKIVLPSDLLEVM